MSVKSVSIRIEEEMLKKIGFIADYEGRSVNSQMSMLSPQKKITYIRCRVDFTALLFIGAHRSHIKNRRQFNAAADCRKNGAVQ